jgi:kynureninase
MSIATPSALDAADPLAAWRERFALPEGVVYLDGNSLGALPKATAGVIARTVEADWGRDLIKSWNTAGWIDLARDVARDLAVVVGCDAGEITVGDSISVNLFKLFGAARSLRPERATILADRRNFPTDLYVAEGFTVLTGMRLELVPTPADLAAAVTGETALVMASHVDYRSGAILDIDRLTEAAHGHEALVLADLAHSAGVLPVELGRRGIDMAVGCGYKYLNGGPGAPAFLFLARRHQAQARNPIAGWFGHAEPFAFRTTYRPAASIDRFQAGTPPILSLRALKEGTAIAAEAPIEQVRAKAMSLTETFLGLFDRQLGDAGFTLVSPRDPERRGAQLAFNHPKAWPITQALLAADVVPDFRAPDIVRFGFAPLYIRHGDLEVAVDRLARIMRDKVYDEPAFAARAKVT